MTITILPEGVGKDGVIYRAISGARQSEGKTAGEALDELAKQLTEEETATLVIVQNHRPDRFFTAQQRERLGELMTRWRSARDVNDTLPTEEEAELERLVEAELKAATGRARAVSQELKEQAATQTDAPEVEKSEGSHRSGVLDDEEKLNNDARRFASWLVSEIKLYNEQKVTGQRLRHKQSRAKRRPDYSPEDAVRAALDRLPAKHRLIVELFYSGLSNNEIAARFNQSPDTVKKSRRLAMSYLRRILRPVLEGQLGAVNEETAPLKQNESPATLRVKKRRLSKERVDN